MIFLAYGRSVTLYVRKVTSTLSSWIIAHNFTQGVVYVGIDVAKYKHDLAVIDSEGEIFVRHLKIANNREGFTQLQMTLKNLKISTGQKIQVALGDTVHYSFNIIHFLRTKGYPTFSYNPFLVKEFAKSQSLRKSKTDKKDAMTIARKLRNDVDKTLFEADGIMIELKYATRNSYRLKQDCANYFPYSENRISLSRRQND